MSRNNRFDSRGICTDIQKYAMKMLIPSLLLIFLVGCAGTQECKEPYPLYSSTLDHVSITIDGEFAWNYMCNRHASCFFKLTIAGVDYFIIYSVDDNAIIGQEIQRVLKYKQTRF